ncbi:MAG: hypothetical protein LBH47_00135 [Christensenellaceae bacterium]|jgi:hypothetical protein|nr:hypothetical protein [Christensenellaceae bacterium]
MSQIRTPISVKLDKLYNKNIRCPYCGTQIPKWTSTCVNCGLSKSNIANSAIKDKNNTKTVLTTVRPDNLPFWKIAIACFVGFLGIHCFVSKKYIRGFVILGLFVISIIFTATLFGPESTLRALFEKYDLLPPTDLSLIASFAMWIWDWFGVLFGYYKYPVTIKN